MPGYQSVKSHLRLAIRGPAAQWHVEEQFRVGKQLCANLGRMVFQPSPPLWREWFDRHMSALAVLLPSARRAQPRLDECGPHRHYAAFDAFFRRIETAQTPGFQRWQTPGWFEGFGFQSHGDSWCVTHEAGLNLGHLRPSTVGLIHALVRPARQGEFRAFVPLQRDKDEVVCVQERLSRRDNKRSIRRWKAVHRLAAGRAKVACKRLVWVPLQTAALAVRADYRDTASALR